MLRIGAKRAEYHRFARYAHKQRQSHLLKFVQACHHLIVLIHSLAKSESGVDNDVLYTSIAQCVCLSGKVGYHIIGNIGIFGKALHRSGCATHVHKYIRHFQACHGVEHGSIERSSAHIIDYLHPIVFYTSLGYLGPECIYRHQNITGYATDCVQTHRQTAILFFRCHFIGIGACGICPDVYHVHALFKHLPYATAY